MKQKRLILAVLLLIIAPLYAFATWTPPPGFIPSKAVEMWFRAHASCCLKAERVRTKFQPSMTGDWQYRLNGAWRTVPSEVVSPEGVMPPPGHETDPAFWGDAQFQQLRAEGVLFMIGDMEECFFPAAVRQLTACGYLTAG